MCRSGRPVLAIVRSEAVSVEDATMRAGAALIVATAAPQNLLAGADSTIGLGRPGEQQG